MALDRLHSGRLDTPRKGKPLWRDNPRGEVEESLRDAAKRLVALNAAAEALPQHRGDVQAVAGYGTGNLREKGTYCLLDRELTAIPGPSEAANADLRDILFPEDQYMLSEQHLLLPTSQRPTDLQLARIPVPLGVKQGDYPTLLHRMFSSGMIRFYSPNSGIVENSLFGVWKAPGVSQRLIWGGTRSNCLFRPEASYVELPTPDVLSEIILPADQELFLASCDISQYYNRLRAPEFLVPLLGLPRVRSSQVQTDITSEYVIPCLLCIPMGATFAVSLAQAASLAIVRRSHRIGPPISQTASLPLAPKRGVQVVYIDDITTLGTRRAKVNQESARIVDSMRQHNLPEANGKRQVASSGVPGVALGLWWWREGILAPQPSLAATLLHDT